MKIHQWVLWPSHCIEHTWQASSNSTINQERRCVSCGIPNWIDFASTGVMYHESREDR